MNLPEYALKNARVVWFFLLVLLVGGVAGFATLGKKEDSTFVIKSASLLCRYPGATPAEVEQLVTEPVEREVQSMRRVHKITSESRYGLSKILVELDPATPARDIPQLWDELRRKVLDVQAQLPAEASRITVADDFGDVFGIYYGLSADEGFSWSELRDWAQRIKTHVVTVGGVRKVTLFGEQTPVVNVYVSLAALANFSIRPETVVQTISQQNAVVDSGEKQAGALRIRILESGTYRSLEDIADQLLISSSGRQYRLGDIARIERGYADPPQTLMRVNGRRAIGIGISTEEQVDVVRTGERIDAVLAALVARMPVGMDLAVLYPENRIAREANRTFVLNLAESVGIVILVIMLVMGARSGVLIGSSLLFSIGGTLLLMQLLGEGLNRTSLAGFIIAMGILVDNAIVVTDNARQAMLRGIARRQAFVDGANAPRWSLLGATLIAVCSFLPLYLAPSSVAEIVKPLFVVLALSLLLSWVLALTQTPLFGSFLLRAEKAVHDPYDTKFYRAFDRLLAALLRWRWTVVAGVAVLFAASLAVMGRMPQNFFPSLDKPYFRADVLLPEGYDIRATEENLLRMDDMTPDKVAAIERLLAEYSLRLGMSDVELEAYLNRYYEENPKEKEFYDMCDRLCNSKPVFDENRFREELFRELNSSPMSEKRLSDLGWLRYQTVRETYLNQPFFLRWFGSQEARIKRAIKDTTIIHDMFCRLVTENCIESERWYFNHKEPEYIKEV